MKRSEMLSIIQMYLEESDLSDLPEDADYHSRKLLNIIEDAGMLPPALDLGEQCSDPQIDISPSYFEEYVPQRIIMGWEDE